MGRHGNGDGGFTLIEVLIAMALIAVVVVGLAGLITLAVRVAQGAREQTLASILAAQKLEQLRSTPGSSGPMPGGSLDTSLPGYADWLDERGQLAGGAGVAVYVRRWAVAPAPSLSNVAVLSVLVSTVARDAQAPAGTPRARQANEALLLTLSRVW